MRNSEKFDRYKNIKSNLACYNYRDINLGKLTGYLLADLIYNFPGFTVKQKIKFLKNRLLFIPEIKKLPENSKSLYLWSIDRDDYNKLAQAYIDELGLEFDNVSLGYLAGDWRYGFSLKNFLFAMKISIIAPGIQLMDRVFAFICIYNSINYLDVLEGNINPLHYSRCISFNSSFYQENIFVLFLRKYAVKTFSLQHGMYFEYINTIPFDVINYENVAAKYLLVWGEYSKRQVEKYLPFDSEAIVYGNPLLRDPPDINRACSHFSNDILVCLPRKIYLSKTRELLSIISDEAFRKYRFIIRLHPSMDKDSTADIVIKSNNITFSDEKTLLADLQKTSFKLMISFNSTAVFESLAYGLPVLQFVCGNDEFLLKEAGHFRVKDELLDCISASPVVPDSINYYFSRSVNPDCARILA